MFRQLSTWLTADWLFSNALLHDNNTWLVLSYNEAYRYDIQLNYWLHIGNLNNSVNLGFSSAAIDPSTGQAYVPNGFVVPGTSSTFSLLQYDVAENKASEITAPGAPDDQLLSYSTMWCPYL